MMSRRVFAFLIILATGSAAQARQGTSDPSQILTLARGGRAADAWQLWAAQPETPETLRLGVKLAIETKQLPRGIDVYTKLAAQNHGPDRPALTDLALASAEELSNAPDLEARLAACAAALGLKRDHGACRKALDAVLASTNTDERAWAVYTLADAGLPLRPGDLGMAERNMSNNMRMRIVQSMTHLRPAERVALLQPVLNDPDVATRYQGLMLLGGIPGTEAASALRYEQGGPSLPTQLKTAIVIGLARHGDQPSIEALGNLLPMLGAYEKVQAARALAQAKNAQGAAVLQSALQSGTDIDRIAAAEAVAGTDPATARPVVLEILTSGSPAIRQRALRTAGALELGTDRAAYRWLIDSSPLVRAAAVGAIQETFALQDARSKARRP